MSCIEHTQSGSYGYKQYDGRVRLWHRVVYVTHNNLEWQDIVGKVVRHKCDNPRCINPEHLEIGTHSDNMLDMYARGRNHNSYTGVPNERHGMCKISNDTVLKIRELAAQGLTRKELRQMFNLSKSQIQRIVTGASRVL